MAKLRLTGEGKVSTVIIKSRVNTNSTGTITAPRIDEYELATLTKIEVTTNHIFNVTDSYDTINKLEANTGGTLNFNNSCIKGETQTAIYVGQDSAINLTGEEMNLGQITLVPNCNFSFIYKDINFNIKIIDSLPRPIIVNNINCLAKLCIFLNDENFDQMTLGNIPLEYFCALKTYRANKKMVDIMLKDNFFKIQKIENKSKDVDSLIESIEKYINFHFFAFTAVAKQILQSENGDDNFFGYLPKDLRIKIASYINFEDINTEHVQIIGDNNYKNGHNLEDVD